MLNTFTRNTLLENCPTNCVRFTMYLILNPILSLLFPLLIILDGSRLTPNYNPCTVIVSLVTYERCGFVSKDESWPYFFLYSMLLSLHAILEHFRLRFDVVERKNAIEGEKEDRKKRTWMIFSRTTFHPLDNGTSVYHAAAYDAAHSSRSMLGDRCASLKASAKERNREKEKRNLYII